MTGDVLEGHWGVFVCTRFPLKLTMEPNLLTHGVTLANRYESLIRPASPDLVGRRSSYAVPYSVGVAQEILAIGSSRERGILGRNNQLEARSVSDIWKRELLLPMMEGPTERPTLTDQIAIFGEWRRQGDLREEDQGAQDDALWRASPCGIGNLY